MEPGDILTTVSVGEERILRVDEEQPASGWEVVALKLENEGLCIFATDNPADPAVCTCPSPDFAGPATSTISSISDGGTVVRLGFQKRPEVLPLSCIETMPRSIEGHLLSYGSRFHPDKCTPCGWLKRAKGCPDGALCVLCHHPHEGSALLSSPPAGADGLRERHLAERPAERPARAPQPERVASQLAERSAACQRAISRLNISVKNTFLHAEEALAKPITRCSSGPSLSQLSL